MNTKFFAEARRESTGIMLLPPDALLPTEQFIEARVQQVAYEIASRGFWLQPILVERGSWVIMDGHHRREFARRTSLKVVPCLLLDYSQVELESRQAGIEVTAHEIIARGLEGRPYPPKTTRHIMNSRLHVECRYALADLAKSMPVD
ncbi:ParB N-terminal domain-containing protein [Pseudomonas sp. SMN5]|uniref:ParB N-terminal domain-containing protein n=1 Tax=Pseudomonas sp. SMN5 TaxID=3390198 RepID=UPI003F84AE9D